MDGPPGFNKNDPAIIHASDAVCKVEDAIVMVTIIRDRSSERAVWRRTSMTNRPVSASRALVGSSQTISLGRCTKPWQWPPAVAATGKLTRQNLQFVLQTTWTSISFARE